MVAIVVWGLGGAWQAPRQAGLRRRGNRDRATLHWSLKLTSLPATQLEVSGVQGPTLFLSLQSVEISFTKGFQ